MNYLFSAVLLVGAVLAAYLGIQSLSEKRRKPMARVLVAGLGLASSVWSACFGIIFLLTDPKQAYPYRVVGMLGVFAYLIFMQLLVNQLTHIPKKWCILFDLISLCGIPIYIMVTKPSQTVFYLGEWGMTYHFKSSLGNNLYTLYSIVMAVDICFAIFYMLKHETTRRSQILGHRFLFVEAVIIFGMVLDTIFPLFGISAVPGSSVCQFYGFLIILQAMSEMEKNDLIVPNMSEFVYYSLSIPVMVYDEQKRIRILNDATSHFFGKTREELESSGAHMEELFDVREDVLDFTGKKKTVEAVCRYNEAHCRIQIDKIFDGYGDEIGFIVIVNDITTQVEAIRHLEEARFEAEAANRTKSVFLANMSHEIRTPMNAIVGFSNLLLRQKLPEEEADYARGIRDSAQNLLAIINDILDISRIESGRMELVLREYPPQQLLREICYTMNPLAKEKNLSFQEEFDNRIPRLLYGDATRLREIFINLLSNAIRYTKKGKVIFRASLVSIIGNQAWMRFEVEDTGVGIPLEERERIFESFAQVNHNVHEGLEGSGLGLSIVHGFVDMMGGAITVESRIGIGSRFTVDLPQKIIDSEAMGESPRLKPTTDFSSIGDLRIKDTRVLVVDDNEVNLHVVESILKCYNLESDLAFDGPQAIAMCRKREYPIVFLDQMMPGMDGVEAMKQIRTISESYAKGGSCKVVALTANVIRGTREELMELGFDEFLGKPVELEKLEEVLVRFLPEDVIYYENKNDSADEDVFFIPGVDTTKGMLQCGKTMEHYLHILKLFLSNGPKLLKSMDRSWRAGQVGDYTIHIHGTKSLCYSIGAVDCGDLAKELEAAGRREDVTFLQENIPVFVEAFTRLLSDVEQSLLRIGELPGEQAEAAEEKMSFEELKKELANAVEAFDFARGASVIAEMKELKLTKEQQEACLHLERAMEEMDLDALDSLL